MLPRLLTTALFVGLLYIAALLAWALWQAV